MNDASLVENTVNDAGTAGKIDTRLTQPRSGDVRQWLGATRRQYGAASPIGQYCTRMLEVDENYRKEPDPIARRNMIVKAARLKVGLERLLVCRGNHR